MLQAGKIHKYPKERTIMRKLKLQMQLTIDGFVGGPNGELDWMTWDWDDDLKNYVADLHKSIDTILLGRKMTDGFIKHWYEASKKPGTEEYEFANLMIDTPKYVFSKTLTKSNWVNTELAGKDTPEFVKDLKKQNGKDIIVYGGADFVGSLIKDNLIDEYYLFTNPAAIGKGLTIYDKMDSTVQFKVKENKAFDCGVVLNLYTPENSKT